MPGWVSRAAGDTPGCVVSALSTKAAEWSEWREILASHCKRPLLAKVEAAKKKIVATKEGGAITGEERIREHADHLYSALLSWEGKPARYLLERTDALRRELADVKSEFDALQPQIQALRLPMERVPSSVPPMMSACIHADWDGCAAPVEMETR